MFLPYKHNIINTRNGSTIPPWVGIKVSLRPKESFMVLVDRVRDSGCPVCHNKIENMALTKSVSSKNEPVSPNAVILPVSVSKYSFGTCKRRLCLSTNASC